MFGGRPKLYNNVEDMEKDIEEYFNKCDEDDRPYTISGLAYHLNMDRKSLLNYSKDDMFFPTLKSAKEKIQAQLEENALLGKGNATFTIFNLKNNYGWKDTIETNNNVQIDKLDAILTEIKGEANNDTD